MCRLVVALLLLHTSLPAAGISGYEYLFPAPGSVYVSRFSSIIIRFESIDPRQLTNISTFIQLYGSRSGEISGKTRVASDGRTIICQPAAAFHPGERVTVDITPQVSANISTSLSTTRLFFTISQAESKPSWSDSVDQRMQKRAKTPIYGKSLVLQNGVSIPSDFPKIKITIKDQPADGYIFLNNWGGQPYNMILDNQGYPIWYLRTPDRRRDFKVQDNGDLSMLVRQDYPYGPGFISLDNTYTENGYYYAVNGYATDEHELQILADGHYLLLGIRSDQVDMSQYVSGGQKNATVYETCIQEFTPEGDLIFQWRAWDHFDIRDVQLEDVRGNSIRFPHMNAIDIDDDGHILLSSRHLSEVTKIHRQTGEIIWRLSGAHNQFTFVNDPLNGFRSQHDIRALGNATYTVFDNGNLHRPPVSRAVEYKVDVNKKTATLIWQFRDQPDKYSEWMGNVQRLPNNNTLINWADGSLPKLTEVRPDGKKSFEMWYVENIHCYRVFRFPWQGVAKVPYLIVEPSNEAITLLFNKFGDSNVAYYKIYADTHPNATTLVDTSRMSVKSLIDLQNEQTYYFRVTAVNLQGRESGYSNEESAFVKLIDRSGNMVLNGDFASGKGYWKLSTNASAAANWSTAEQVGHIHISNGGSELWHVQLDQAGMLLLNGEDYLFEFDAWADAPRPIGAVVLQQESPFTNYGEIGLTALSTRSKHFAYTFKMKHQTDFNAAVVFILGQSVGDVYIDNVSLKRIVDARITREEQMTPQAYALFQNYPNPFNSTTSITYQVPEESDVRITLYNVLGKVVESIVDSRHPGGIYAAHLDASMLDSGLYFYEMTAFSLHSGQHVRYINKMTLIK
ncbi:T9SS C-terminal target domain-containing protein [candidate division KSB1 bacterium]|nr:aryl-sulfate sulfotransferase [candidate division KSB1 bacterium]RQW01023.1 MAG: T9SS C-terminal target domain-containing protein [candidate division KSB1 bacterium]